MTSSFSAQRGLILLLIAFILLVGVVSADLPIPSFTSNVTSGNVPFDVQFNVTMDETIPPIFVNWSFGDGNFNNQTALELQNVTYTYSIVGSYPVSLEITDIGGTNTTTITDYITANPQPPVASFTQDKTGGVELVSVQFTDTSTNTPTSWSWVFNNKTGNNTPIIFSTNKNPLWNFGMGNYSIQVTATNAGGYGISAQNAWVNVSEHPPIASFTVDKTSGSAPLTILLTDTSTYAPTSWLFEGQNTTGNNTWTPLGTTTPLSIALGYGLWNVRDTATNSGGSDTATTQEVNVTAPFLTGGFHANATSGNVPVSVSFTDDSTNATIWSYTFGDGNTSTSQNPVFTYNIIGTYTVVQIVSNQYGTTNTTTKTNYITVLPQPPVASFTKNTTGGLFPVTVLFTDTSTNIPTSWAWDFGDTGTSAVRNPVHTYSSGGTYTISLTATNAGGSSAPVTDTITITNSTVSGFSGNPTSGIFPLTVQFNRTVPNDNATVWNMSMGDGSWTNTTIPDLANASHTYSTGGLYTVRLITSNPYYTNSTTLTNYITVHNSTVSGFACVPTGGMVPITVTCNVIIPNNNATYVNWTLGDGSVSNKTAPDFNISHTYSHGGIYSVVEEAANPFFSNITTLAGYILAENKTVSGFNSMFITVAFNVTHPEDLNTTYTNWTFGDGAVANITTNGGNTTHTYTTPGAYNVTETASNVYYSVSTTIQNYVVLIDSKTVFLASLDPPGPFIGNHPYPLVVKDSSTGSPFTQCQISWGDGTAVNDCGTTLVHQYQLPGMYPINLAITDYGQRTSSNQTTAFIF